MLLFLYALKMAAVCLLVFIAAILWVYKVIEPCHIGLQLTKERRPFRGSFLR
jgi:hypothetical protein